MKYQKEKIVLFRAVTHHFLAIHIRISFSTSKHEFFENIRNIIFAEWSIKTWVADWHLIWCFDISGACVIFYSCFRPGMCFQNGALAISTKREKNNEKPSMVKKGNQSIQLGINKLPKKKEKRKNKRERSEKY